VEKRALLAIVLSVAVMAVWMLFYPPPAPTPHIVPPPAAVAQPADQVPTQGAAPAAVQDKGQPASAGTPSIAAGAKEEFRLITGTQDIRFTNEGGRVTWWRLPHYTIDGGVPVDLIPEQAHLAGVLPLQIEITGEPQTTLALAKALHVHEMADIPAGDPSGVGPGKRVTFTYADGAGLSVRKTLEMPDQGYLGSVSFEVTRNSNRLPATLIWASGLAQKAEDDTRGYGHVEGEGVVHDGREIVRVPAQTTTAQRDFTGAGGLPLRWAGLESTYFASVLLPKEGGPALAVTIQPRKAAAAAGSTATAPLLTAGALSQGEGSWRMYVGPKDYYQLKAIGSELERVIDFSRFSIIYLCTKGLFLALTWINGYVGNYGFSIILLTVIVRLVFFPITYKSSITMRQTSKKMAKIQPRVKSIQERYRKLKKSMETQKQMNEEVMALYKKEGINPMSNLGGCLPLLLQMPIFIGFYNLLAVTIEMRHAPFGLWLQDLSRRDPNYITPLLMGASWIAQQWMTSSSIPDPTQRKMMMFMPVIFTFFMMNMPSGLVIYWLTSNILGMVQQYVTNKRADELDLASSNRAATS